MSKARVKNATEGWAALADTIEELPATQENVTESRVPVFKMVHGGTGKVIRVFYDGTVTGLEPDDDGWMVVNLIPTLCNLSMANENQIIEADHSSDLLDILALTQFGTWEPIATVAINASEIIERYRTPLLLRFGYAQAEIGQYAF